jgi:enoyl-CoA hydratase/carnithine racemase
LVDGTDGSDPSGSPPEAPVAVEHHTTEHGRIAIVRMTRPRARNAMDTSMLASLVESLTDAGDDAETLGVLLAGDGGQFSAGADVREEMSDNGERRMELFTTFYELLSVHPKPTVAAVEGFAVGGGAEAAAACDVRVAATSARFRFPGATYGIPVGTARTVGLVGLGTAKDWVLSSRDVGAEEAHRVGFVQQLVEDGAAEEAALDWLVRVAGSDAGTVQRLKAALNNFAGLPDRVAWENDALRAHVEGGGVPPRVYDTPTSGGAFGMPSGAQES